jgi:hypothetical protein
MPISLGYANTLYRARDAFFQDPRWRDLFFVTTLDAPGTSDGNVVSRNIANSRLSDGILVNADATQTLIQHNSANRNGHDGIETDAKGSTLRRNSANRNHDLGIEAAPGVIDGGGNHAFGNGNPAQCLNIAC